MFLEWEGKLYETSCDLSIAISELDSIQIKLLVISFWSWLIQLSNQIKYAELLKFSSEIIKKKCQGIFPQMR